MEQVVGVNAILNFAGPQVPAVTITSNSALHFTLFELRITVGLRIVAHHGIQWILLKSQLIRPAVENINTTYTRSLTLCISSVTISAVALFPVSEFNINLAAPPRKSDIQEKFSKNYTMALSKRHTPYAARLDQFNTIHNPDLPP